MSKTAKTIYLVLYEGVQLLDVAGPAEVFSQANVILPKPKYELKYISASAAGFVKSSAGLCLQTQPLPKTIPAMDMILLPGAGMEALEAALGDSVLNRWLACAFNKAKTVASVCTGAFFLGSHGLLDNKRVTTHWMGAIELKRRYAKAQVEEDTLYIQDGALWTSAGVLSGVDMALAMVKQDLGSQQALLIARQLVVFLFRGGGQSQFSGSMELQTRAGKSDLLRLIHWLESHLAQSITVEAMAQKMHVSVRTLHRKCVEVLELTPAKLLSELRLEQGRSLLHQNDIAIKAIASECGFATSAAFSKAFSQRFGVAPQIYKQRFHTD